MEGRQKGGTLLYGGFILLQSIVYGFGNPLTKIAYESISALWCLTIRFAFAFLLFMLIFGKRIVTDIKAARFMDYFPASLCMTLAYTSCNLALARTSATNVGFLMSFSVVFAPILSAIVEKKKFNLMQIPLLAAVVLGLYLLCCNGHAFAFGAGEAIALVTAVSVAGGLVFGERALKSLGALTISATQAGMTAALNLVLALLFDDAAALSSVRPEAWGVVAYLAVFCTCAAYMLQNAALRHISASAVSLLQCTQPILTALISFIILNERLTAMGLIGAGIIMLCILAQNLLPALREQPPVPMEQ